MVENRSAPSATVVPILVYEDPNQAVEWLCRVFGFIERLRFERDGMVGHAQLDIGEGAIMLGRAGGPFRPPQPDHVSQFVHVTVDDVDRHHQIAKECGARILEPPADKPFGERQYTVEDPGGHRWVFSQHVKDVAPEEWGATSAKAK